MATQINQALAAATTALQTKLDALKGECTKVFNELHASRKRGYENIVNILMWWIEAKQDNYFDELTLGDEFRQGREVNHGHNFSPLLKHLFGLVLSDQHRNKLSRALNALLKEYERNPDMYASNASIKLVNYIQHKGGFVQLIKGTYSKAELTADGDHELAAEIAISEHEQRVAEEAALTDAEMAGWNFKYKLIHRYTVKETRRVKDDVVVQKLLPTAKDSLSNLLPPTASFDGSILTNQDGYAIALVKRESKDYALLNNLIDQSLVNSSIVNAYRKKYDACPTSLRLICETLRTQLLPATLKLKQKDLVQVITDPLNPNEEKLARTRLLYNGTTGALTLSPMHLKTGVVTSVKPKSQFMQAGSYDVALTGISKSTVEQKLLNELAFNLYQPDQIGQIPTLKDDALYSHRLTLTHKADEKSSLQLHFNTFENYPEFAHEQTVYDSEYENRIIKTFQLSSFGTAAISKRVAEMWLHGIDDHITRESNLQMQINVTEKSILLCHTLKDGKFASEHRLVYDQSGDDSKTVLDSRFLTKDVMPVLASLGHLPIEGDVTFKFGPHVLLLEFSTGIAEYSIAIPAVDTSSKSVFTDAFKTYKPIIREHQQESIDEKRIDLLLGEHELNDYSAHGAIYTTDDIETIYVEI